MSWKMASKGHPWVTKDSFTQKFGKTPFVFSKKEGRHLFLINDPDHPMIKARLWESGTKAYQEQSFLEDLKKRLSESMQKRTSIQRERQNLFLAFAEADRLPGLQILQLGDVLIIGIYSLFWKRYEKQLVNLSLDLVSEHFSDIDWKGAWVQYRLSSKEKLFTPYPKNKNVLPKDFTLNEFNLSYKIRISKNYDMGIYTDMSSIRKSLEETFKKSDSVLNLYSYTGAYTLFALKHGAINVTSIDLSDKYMKWLEENIELNGFSFDKHNSMVKDVKKGLEQLAKEGHKFDLVISDPPSFSSDGKGSSSAIKSYEQILPQISNVIADQGMIIIFLNTHKITRNKYELQIKSIIDKANLNLKITKRLSMSEDCPQLKGFPEGSYLKGLVLQATKDKK
jgi:23S rRNA (cytosine1962-C5)-methyltransferase